MLTTAAIFAFSGAMSGAAFADPVGPAGVACVAPDDCPLADDYEARLEAAAASVEQTETDETTATASSLAARAAATAALASAAAARDEISLAKDAATAARLAARAAVLDALAAQAKQTATLSASTAARAAAAAAVAAAARDNLLDESDKVVPVTPPTDELDALPAQEVDATRDVDATLPPVHDVEKGVGPTEAQIAAFAAQEAPSEPTTKAFVAGRLRYGAPIKRSLVISRAKNWLARNVQYNTHGSAWDVNHGKRYRTDCSGFLSMTWALSQQRSTRDLGNISTRINWSTAKPGDMVLRNGHVQLFEKWGNKGKTKFWIIELGSEASDMNHRLVTVAAEKRSGYRPWKYNKIRD
ncbi:MAG TPA: hypothetical protein VF755_28760 [Catenuloplanes sp.]